MYSISITPSYYHYQPNPNNPLNNNIIYRRQKQEFYIISMNHYKFATMDNPASSLKQI